jgi:hypothetical protein
MRTERKNNKKRENVNHMLNLRSFLARRHKKERRWNVVMSFCLALVRREDQNISQRHGKTFVDKTITRDK